MQERAQAESGAVTQQRLKLAGSSEQVCGSHTCERKASTRSIAWVLPGLLGGPTHIRKFCTDLPI